MVDNNIITGDDTASIIMGLWAFYLHDYKVFKRPICIIMNRIFTDRQMRPTSCCTNLHITFFRNPEREPCYVDDKEIKVQDNKVLSYFLSNELNHKITVVMDDIEDPTYTRINISGEPTTKLNKASISSSIISVFPKIFTEIKINKDKILVLKSLLKDRTRVTDEELLFYTSEIMEDELTSILSSNFSHLVKKCIEHSRTQQIKKIEQNIDNINNEANQLLTKYDSLMDQKSDYDRLIISLTAGGGQNVDETEKIINDLFLNNSSIQEVCVDGDLIRYKVMTHLDYYEKELFEAVTTPINPGDLEENIYILNSVESNCTRKEMYYLLMQIFQERKYRIRVYGCFELQFNLNNESLNSVYLEKQVIDNYAPSPHGQLFDCTGTFRRQWEEAIKTGEIYMAISYTIAFTQNLNWSDSTVIKTMIKYLSSDWWDEKILEDENGNLFTPRQAMEARRKENDDKQTTR